MSEADGQEGWERGVVSETTLSRNIQEALARMGVRVLRLQSGRVRVKGGWMQLAPEGTPDLLAILKSGRVLWIEVKRPGEKPTAEQLAEHARLLRDGHAVAVVTTVQEAVDAVLRQKAAA